MTVMDILLPFLFVLLKPVSGYLTNEDLTFVHNSGTQLRNKLTKFADEILGISKLEAMYVSDVIEKRESFDAKKNIEKIVATIGRRLQNNVNKLHKNRRYIEQKFNDSNIYNSTNPCCHLQASKYLMDVVFDYDHKQPQEMCNSNVNLKNVSKIPKEANLFFHADLSPTDGIIWQYFGDAFGNYHQYPEAPKFCSGKETKDHRFESWYVNTASHHKKNIIVIIDESGSMLMPIGGMGTQTPRREDLAKEAANSVLNTLGPSDHVGMVAFSTNARSPAGCLGTKMARATQENKHHYRKFISSIQPNVATFYGKAFAEAFKLFNASKQQSPEQFTDSLDMILFLTDGFATDQNKHQILEEVAKGQSWMDNKVHIFVYGLGQEILLNTSNGNTSMKILHRLADQNNKIIHPTIKTMKNVQLQWPVLNSLPNNTQPVGPPGNITFISDSDGPLLKEIMGKYYTQFPVSQQSHVTITLPHSDVLSGPVITLGLPTVDGAGNFLGVTAIDISFERIFYEVIHFKQRRFSYSFLVGNGGIVLSHPYMTLLSRNRMQNRIYYVQQLEPSLSTDALKNISNGIEGEESASAIIWRDNGKGKQIRDATFYIRPVPRFEQNYTAVFVIFKDDLHEIITEKANISLTDTEIITTGQNISSFDEEDLCYINNNVNLHNSSDGTFMFARDLSRHLSCQPFGSRQKCLFDMYGNKSIDTNPVEDYNYTIKSTVSVDLFVTEAVSQYWSNSTDIIRRYIGTESGVFRINPGIFVHDDVYDPREDYWYGDAIGKSDIYIYSVDSIINQPNAVSITSTYQTNSTFGSVGGVIGSEVHYHHLQMYIMNTISDCFSGSKYSCYLLDNKGYLFLQFTGTKHHITHKLPDVSDYLIRIGNLQFDWCIDLITGDKHLSYHLSTGGQTVQYNSTSICTDFVLSPVNNTNLYLLVTHNSTACTTKPRQTVCPCSENCTSCDIKQLSCQCPCVCRETSINNCDPKFDLKSGYRPCAGSANRNFKMLKSLSLDVQRISQNISKCKQPCIMYNNRSHCEAVSGCVWCQSTRYKTFPVCLQYCIQDRIEIKLFSPCLNLTEFDATEQDTLMDELRDRVVSLTDVPHNLTVSQPHIISDMSVKLFVQAENEQKVKDEVINTLWKTINISSNSTDTNNVTFLPTDSTDYSDFQIIMHLNGINFTEKLEDSLTLRSYVHKIIRKLAEDTFIESVASTVTDIWLENNIISFWIHKTLNLRHVRLEDQIELLVNKQNTMPLQFNLLDDIVNVSHITTSGSFSQYCPVTCEEMSAKETCQRAHRCHWDVYEQNCTSNPYLPERINFNIYFPCLGLYDSFNGSDQTTTETFIAELRHKIREMIPSLSSKALHSFVFNQSSEVVGSYIQVVVQGTLEDRPVTEIIWMLTQHLSWTKNFRVHHPYHNQSYLRSDVTKRTYKQFTNMHVYMEIDGLNLTEFLDSYPLNGRDEIMNAIKRIAMSHFLPSISNSAKNLIINKDGVQFVISKSPTSTVDLRTEYERLQISVHKNDVKMVLFGKEFKINSTYFVGTFDNICPRNCDDGLTDAICDSIPGCRWSRTQQNCTNNYLLPEKKEIQIIFSCAGLNNLTSSRNNILSSVEQSVRKHPVNISHGAIHSFKFGKVYSDSVSFTLQKMTRDMSLTESYKQLINWIRLGHVKLGVGQNGSSIVGTDAENYDSFEITLVYPSLHLVDLGLNQEKKNINKVKRQLNDFIMPEFRFEKGYSYVRKNQTLLILTAHKELNSSDFDQTVDKIRRFIDIGGLSVIVNRTKYLPDNVKHRGSINNKCPNKCEKSLDEPSCVTVNGCHWESLNNYTGCTNDSYIKKWLTIDLHIPCNRTRTLNSTEMMETRDDLYRKVTTILHPISSKVLKDISVTKISISVKLQATTLFPFLHTYGDIIEKAEIKFGPKTDSQRFVVRKPKDYTNYEVTLTFDSIDFDAMQHSLLADKYQIVQSLHRRLDSLLLGETMQNFRLLSVSKDNLKFEFQKEMTSSVDFRKEMKRLETEVLAKKFILDLTYIRPVIATSVKLDGTFNSLCPDKDQFTFAPNTPSSLITVANITPTASFQTPTLSGLHHTTSIILVYNSSKVTETDLESNFNATDNLHVCYVPANNLLTALPKFGIQIDNPCPHTKDNNGTGDKSNHGTMETPGKSGIGPGEASGITLAAVLALLLAIAIIILAYKMKQKSNLKSSGSSNGRHIEERN